jgi:hypothetical protein
VVFFEAYESQANVSVSDSQGNVYSSPLVALTVGNAFSTGISYALNVGGKAPTAVTVTDLNGPGGNMNIVIAEFSNVAHTAALDGSNFTSNVGSLNSSGGTPNSGSFTTTAAGDLILAIGGVFNNYDGVNATFTAGPRFSIVGPADFGGRETQAGAEYWVQPAAGLTNPAINWSGQGVEAMMAALALKPF